MTAAIMCVRVPSGGNFWRVRLRCTPSSPTRSDRELATVADVLLPRRGQLRDAEALGAPPHVVLPNNFIVRKSRVDRCSNVVRKLRRKRRRLVDHDGRYVGPREMTSTIERSRSGSGVKSRRSSASCSPDSPGSRSRARRGRGTPALSCERTRRTIRRNSAASLAGTSIRARTG